MEFHTIEPIYDHNSKILILGSFPSVRSRQDNFYYAHPQNRFWKVISCLFDERYLETIDDKKAFLLKNKIALWDVVYSCSIEGSSDGSIKDVIVNDIFSIVESSKIVLTVFNGKTAKRLFDKFFADFDGTDTIVLPSTSPANAAVSLDELITKWSVIKKYI